MMEGNNIMGLTFVVLVGKGSGNGNRRDKVGGGQSNGRELVSGKKHLWDELET